jgi:(p)ppGpp synthase/HD superfamily hydrolase
MLFEAIKFAVNAHKGQTRKYGGDAYINHPKRVAGEVALLSYSTEQMVAAAWLHDVVEDCGVSLDTVLKHFGPEVMALVKDLTFKTDNLRHLSYRDLKLVQSQHIAQASFNAKSIKILDRLDNMHDFYKNYKAVAFATDESVKRLASLTRYVAATYDMVNILGRQLEQEIDRDLVYILRNDCHHFINYFGIKVD